MTHLWEQLDQGSAICIRCSVDSSMGHAGECSPFNFFDRRVCLTNHGSEWKTAEAEFKRVGMGRVDRFKAIPDIGPHQSFNRSVRQILTEFLSSSNQRLLHLEDDCQFRDVQHLGAALSELPADWDIVYLGANLLCWNNEDDPKPERVGKYLFRVRQAWCTHAIGYNRKVVPFILDNQPGFSEQMTDNWLSQQLTKLNAYVVAPMVAWQRPRWSDIWSKMVDYDEVFQGSEERLR